MGGSPYAFLLEMTSFVLFVALKTAVSYTLSYFSCFQLEGKFGNQLLCHSLRQVCFILFNGCIVFHCAPSFI